MMIATSSAALMIGKRYTLHEAVGSGGMGTVYRATDHLTQQTVASKAAGKSHLVALANEFHTLTSLRHPNIISVLDYGFDETHQPYFTMEYLPQAKSILHTGKGGFKLAQNELELASQSVQALFIPMAQPQPDVLAVPLQAALQAWQGGDVETARRYLVQAAELAQPLGYL